MKIYKEGDFIIVGGDAYYSKLITYEITDNVVRVYFVGSKIHAIQLGELTDKNDSIVTDYATAFKSLGVKEIEAELTPIEKESLLYEKRILDGKKMSTDLMAELRVNAKVNNLPRDINKYIEGKLDKVKINIDRGWWVTALEELESTTVELYFTQELYDRIHLTISTYISLNY